MPVYYSRWAIPPFTLVGVINICIRIWEVNTLGLIISAKKYTSITEGMYPVLHIPLFISSFFSAFLRTDWRMKLSDLCRMLSRGLLPMFSLASGRGCPPLRQTPDKVRQRNSSGSWIDSIVRQEFLQLPWEREQQGRRMEQKNSSNNSHIARHWKRTAALL